MHPNPLGRDKYVIVEKCLESFLKAKDTDCQITFLADSMDPEWVEKKLRPHGEVLIPHRGNEETFWKQLDLVCNMGNEEKVMVVEDDYLWRPNTLKQIEEALDTLPVVFPYDHPAHHTEERFKDKPKRIRFVNGFTYHDVPSNTLTFATKAYVIKQNYEKIKTFGVRDHELWQSLGVDLWAPNYGIAEHLVIGLESPNYNFVANLV
jgi:hypothetical protein